MTEKIVTHEFNGKNFCFISTPTAPALITEIFSDNYKVIEKGLEFQPGDVIIDVGACEGMFSIMMAVLFPQTHIIALEPVPATYYNLVKNIELNSCQNIEALNLGIGKPKQDTTVLITNKSGHSGGSTSFCTYDPINHDKIEIGLISLDDLFEINKIDRCKLLKIDVEGAEYDILYNATVLDRVNYIVGEIHINRHLEFDSRRPDALATWLSNKTKLLHVELCQMAE